MSSLTTYGLIKLVLLSAKFKSTRYHCLEVSCAKKYVHKLSLTNDLTFIIFLPLNLVNLYSLISLHLY